MTLRLTILMLCSALTGSAAELCIRAGASGDDSGSDWNNAMPTLPTVPVRGNTYYLAAGTLSAQDMDPSPNEGDYIIFKKATIAAHGPATGWSDAYDAQTVINGGIYLDYSRWIFDGVYRNESNWDDASGYGIRFAHNGDEKQLSMGRLLGTISNSNVVQYCYFNSKDSAMNPVIQYGRYTIDIYSVGATGAYKTNYIGYCGFTNGNVFIYHTGNSGFNTSSNLVIEYSSFADNESDGGENHGELLSAYFTVDAITFRYNKCRKIRGTAVLAVAGNSRTVNSLRIYRNDIGELGVSDGSFGFDRTGDSTFNFCFVYHNTIADKLESFNNGVAFLAGSGNYAVNNLWIDTESNFSQKAGITHTNNGYSWGYVSTGEITNVQTSIFQNYAAGDYRLVSNPFDGVALGAPYNVDLNGVTGNNPGAYNIQSGGRTLRVNTLRIP